MAEPNTAAAPAINTNIESGNFDEKAGHHNPEHAPATKPKPEEAEEEDEDIDALIEDLESQDGGDEEEEEEGVSPGQGRTIPEEMLNTDTRSGLTDCKFRCCLASLDCPTSPIDIGQLDIGLAW